MSTAALALPPGATLESAPPPSAGSMRLPPGATLESASKSDDRSLLDHLANDPNNVPLDSTLHATEHGFSNVGQGLAQAAQGTLGLLNPKPQNDEEKKAVMSSIPVMGPAAAGVLPIFRMLRGMGHTAEDAVSLIHQYRESGGPSLGDVGVVAGTTAGNLIPGVVLSPEGVKASGVADISTAKATGPLRAVVRGTNNVLAKAPGSIGAAAGGGLGAATHIPGAAEIGMGVGYALGKEVLPQIQIPGENLGLPKTVNGGPANVDIVAHPEAALERPAASPQPAAAADTSPKNVERLLGEATGAKPLQPNVPLRAQASATPQAASLPADFTPVKSSALKGYKYDPQTQELTSVTNNGQTYKHSGVTPEMMAAFEEAKSKGTAWNMVRKGPGVVLTEKNGVPVSKSTYRSATPEDAAPGDEAAPAASPKTASRTAAAKTPASTSAASGDEDLTALLEESLKQVQRAKSGVEQVNADPAKLAEEWGVDEESLRNTREQTRGMTPEQTDAYTQKLVDAYKKGFPVEPLLETRDQYGNILEVDGRQRAIAAQRAGIKQVPVMRRYLKK